MSGSNSNDKVYVIIILIMIGCFVYWYQTRLDLHTECESCKKRKHRQKKHHQKSSLNKKPINPSNFNQKVKKTVRFKDEKIGNKHKRLNTDKINNDDDDTETSLDSLDSSDRSNLAHAGSSYPKSNKKEDSTNDSDNESCDSIAM